MVEVFKTNIQHNEQVMRVIWGLQQINSEYNVHVDLEDCDRVLRVEAKGSIHAKQIIEQLNKLGFFAETLSDELIYN